MRTSGLVSNQSYVDRERMVHDRQYRSLGQQPNGGPMDLESWSSMQTEVGDYIYIYIFLSFFLPAAASNLCHISLCTCYFPFNYPQ